MQRVKDISAKDDKTFVIALKEPFGLVLDLLAKPRHAALLHHAQEGRRDRPDPADHTAASAPARSSSTRATRRSRAAATSMTSGPNYVPRAGAAHRAWPAARWCTSTGDLGEHRRRADRDGGAAVRRDRLLRDCRRSTCCRSFESDPNIKLEVLNKTGNCRHHAAELAASAVRQGRRRARRCCYLINQDDS